MEDLTPSVQKVSCVQKYQQNEQKAELLTVRGV